MNEVSPVVLQVMFAVALVIFTSYCAGRVHQWRRHGFERELAYREGYDKASNSLFRLAARGPGADQPAGVIRTHTTVE